MLGCLVVVEEEHVVGEQEATLHAKEKRVASETQREGRSGDCESGSEEEKEGGRETVGDEDATELVGDGGKGGLGAGCQVSEAKHDQNDETLVKEITAIKSSEKSNEKVAGGGGKGRQKDKKRREW